VAIKASAVPLSSSRAVMTFSPAVSVISALSACWQTVVMTASSAADIIEDNIFFMKISFLFFRI